MTKITLREASEDDPIFGEGFVTSSKKSNE